jgi:hypothetical protein
MVLFRWYVSCLSFLLAALSITWDEVLASSLTLVEWFLSLPGLTSTVASQVVKLGHCAQHPYLDHFILFIDQPIAIMKWPFSSPVILLVSRSSWSDIVTAAL